jgi:hypothetical protein
MIVGDPMTDRVYMVAASKVHIGALGSILHVSDLDGRSAAY